MAEEKSTMASCARDPMASWTEPRLLKNLWVLRIENDGLVQVLKRLFKVALFAISVAPVAESEGRQRGKTSEMAFGKVGDGRVVFGAQVIRITTVDIRFKQGRVQLQGIVEIADRQGSLSPMAT